MAARKKRRCKHGKTKAGPCRKVPKRRKARKSTSKRSGPKASTGVAKAISAVRRKRCGNPKRYGDAMAVRDYIKGQFYLERDLGLKIRTKAQVKRNLKAIQRSALSLARTVKKCSPRSGSTAIVLRKG